MRCLRTLLAVILLLAFMPPGTGLAASPIIVDGDFGDWSGKAHLEDAFEDTKHHWDDVRYWYWATNDGDSALFFMVERFAHHLNGDDELTGGDIDAMDSFNPGFLSPPGDESPYVGFEGLMEQYGDEGQGNDKEKKPVHYTIFVDTGNNGQFGDIGDAVVYADYYPKLLGFTGVSIFVRRAHNWSRVLYTGFWGDTESEGGLRCEFPVPFSILEIEPGQVLRLVLFAQDKRTDPDSPDSVSEYQRLVNRREADRVPDQGDLQWSPVSALGRFGWLALIVAGAVIPAIAKRRQLAIGGRKR